MEGKRILQVVLVGVFMVLVLAMLSLGGCMGSSHEPDACKQDAKVCPDGTVLARQGASCEFPACPFGERAAASFIPCDESRPATCPEEGSPVCAKRDTGVRCVRAPCLEAVEAITYPNACAACADPHVFGYWADGACER